MILCVCGGAAEAGCIALLLALWRPLWRRSKAILARLRGR